MIKIVKRGKLKNSENCQANNKETSHYTLEDLNGVVKRPYQPIMSLKTNQFKTMLHKRYNQYNPKRKIRDNSTYDDCFLEELIGKVIYGGNPQHKKNPGKFGLTPPSDPRPGKSLCDVVEVFKPEDAEELLKDGIRHGLVSEKMDDGQKYPKNIWSVVEMKDGTQVPLESQLENPEKGTYHGYPLLENDPMYQEILRKW